MMVPQREMMEDIMFHTALIQYGEIFVSQIPCRAAALLSPWSHQEN